MKRLTFSQRQRSRLERLHRPSLRIFRARTCSYRRRLRSCRPPMTGAASTSVSTAAARPATSTGIAVRFRRRRQPHATGGTVGGQVGYRWQMSSWVFGLEAQGNWADFKGSNTSLLFAKLSQHNQSKIDSFGLFTGQIGYAWDRALFYVKGGAAVTDNKYTSITTGVGVGYRYRQRNPLGCGARRRLRIRLRPELVARLRVRSPVHGQQRRRLQCRLHRRPHQGKRRYLHRARELQVRRPGGGSLLSQALHELKPRPVGRGFCLWLAPNRRRLTNGRISS